MKPQPFSLILGLAGSVVVATAFVSTPAALPTGTLDPSAAVPAGAPTGPTAANAEPKTPAVTKTPAFPSAGSGEFTFDTGTLRGTLRSGGKSLGLTGAVHTPTGTPLCQGHGLFSHYRVFTRGKRYGGGAWDWPSEAKLRDDGSVEVRWPAADGRPFEMWAVYRLSGTATLDLETGVRARADIAKFESFLASYFEKRFTSCRVRVKGHEKTTGLPGFLAADSTFGTWLMSPRDADAVRIIQDGRWKIEPSPVDWAILPEMDRPIALRRDAASGVTVVVMARPEDCFAVATPHETEPHYSLYLSLFGRDLKAGEEARARARLLVLVSPRDEQILEAYEAFLKDVRRP